MYALLFLLPISLLLGSRHLHGIPLYASDFVLALIIFTSVRETGLKKLQSTWFSLPGIVRSITLLLTVAWVGGMVRATVFIEGMNALKSWYVLPVLAVISLISYWKAESKTLKKDIDSLQWGIVVFAIVQTLIGLLLLALHHYPENRLAGLFDSPNAYAAAVTPIFFIALRLAVKDKIRIAYLLAGIIALGILFSHSLGGVGALLGGLVLLLLQVRQKWFRIITVFAIMVGVVFLIVNAYARFTRPGGGTSWDSRRQIWHTAYTLVEDYPLAGTGLRSFGSYYEHRVVELYPHPFEVVEKTVPEPHNLYFAFWLDTGFFGLLGMILLVGMLIRAAWKAGVDTFWYAYPLIAFLIHGVVDTPYFWLELCVLFWLYVIILAVPLLHLRNQEHNLE